MEAGMITLFDSESNQPVGQISEAQLRFLMDQLEEESTQDRDYYISQDELDVLQESGADEVLLKVLRAALAGREGAEFSLRPRQRNGLGGPYSQVTRRNRSAHRASVPHRRRAARRPKFAIGPG
jgi:processive 1,2-diacylglycerol beta-glucosyltransferase